MHSSNKYLSAPDTLPMIEKLNKIKVKNTEGETVMLSSLWKNSTVVLKVLRRLGCPFCRFEARLLSELKPEFDSLNVKLVAITSEELGINEFITGGFWEWDILIDEQKLTHKALKIPSKSKLATILGLFSPSTRAMMKLVEKLRIPGNFAGDGYQLGGTFVITHKMKMVYEFRQNSADSFPSLKELFYIVGGDPEMIEESAPAECVVKQHQSLCVY